MSGGLTLRGRGFRPGGLHSQTGRKNGVHGTGWTKGTQLGTDFPHFNFDPWAPSGLRRSRAGESGPSFLAPSPLPQGP